jgi:MFS transporter, CP family, cyanate transporter
MLIRNKYIVEAIAFFSYVLFAMAWVGATANMGQIMEAMNIQSLAAASMLSGAVTLAKIVGTFIAAVIALKLGIKLAFLVSGLMIGIGIFSPYIQSYDLLLVSRFIVGLGGALMVVYFNPIVLHWFEPNERPIVNGLNAVAFNLGTAIVMWLIDDLNHLLGDWQATLSAFSIASIFLALCWCLVDYQEPETTGEGTDNVSTKAAYSYIDGLKDSFNWQYSLSYAGLLGFYICLFTFYPEAGISQGSFVMGAGIIGTLAGIVYSRMVPQRLPIIRWSGLLLTLSVLCLSFIDDAMLRTISAISLGFFMFFPVTALISLPHELENMTPQRITVIFSLFYSISYLVATVILWAFGLMVDASGNYYSAFMMISVLSLSLFAGSFWLPETAPCRQDKASPILLD